MGLIQESKIGRAVSANGNLGVDFTEVKTADILQRGDPQEDFATATSRETRELLRISPLRIFPFHGRQSGLMAHAVEGVMGSVVDDFDGTIEKNPGKANAVTLANEHRNDSLGMAHYKLRHPGGRGSGIVFTSTPSIPEDTNLAVLGRQVLGDGFSHYGVLFVGDRDARTPRSAHVLSMEIGASGAVDFGELGEEEGYRRVALKLTHLAGGEHITRHVGTEVKDKKFRAAWDADELAPALIQALTNLNRLGILNDVGIDDMNLVLTEKKRNRIVKYLGRAGLSEGQAATPAKKGKRWASASGSKKSNLARNEVILVTGVNPELDGVTYLYPEGIDKKEPTVEGLDDMLLDYGWAGVISGELTSADPRELLKFLQDPNRVAKALAVAEILSEAGKDPYTIIHVHQSLDNWDSDELLMTEMDWKLVPGHFAQNSCGTFGLAIQTWQALTRGMLADNIREKMLQGRTDELRMLGTEMVNHGLTFGVPEDPVEAVQRIARQMARTDEGRMVLRAKGVRRT